MLTNLGTINVEQGGTLTLAAVTISNAGAIALSGDAQATLLVESAVILAGGGKVALVGDGNNVISGSSTATLTNAGNTISGAGDIFGLNLVNSGTVNANNPGQTLFVDAARIVNAGLLEDTAAGGLFFQGTPTISNTAKGVILASGAGANVALAGVAVYGGTLKTSAAGDIAFVGAGNVLSGATIATSSLVEVTIDGALRLTGGKIGAGATLETLNGGTAIVSGSVANSGTLFADGGGSLVEIASGAVVNGGIAEIGDGVVEIAGSSGESVKFLSAGSGGLELDGLGRAYAGRVSGFGGSGHTDHNQFIAFTAIGGGASVSYTSAASHTSGTLMVVSGGVSATVTLVGTYSAGNFVSTTVDGHVAITDPGVVNGGSTGAGMVGASAPLNRVDLPDIAFGAQTTLAYSRNSADTGGTLTVTDGRHAAAIALLGNYMAGSFVAAADGHGGTLVTETLQTHQPPPLSHPRA